MYTSASLISPVEIIEIAIAIGIEIAIGIGIGIGTGRSAPGGRYIEEYSTGYRGESFDFDSDFDGDFDGDSDKKVFIQ